MMSTLSDTHFHKFVQAIATKQTERTINRLDVSLHRS
jgi:hypothetical protein